MSSKISSLEERQLNLDNIWNNLSESDKILNVEITDRYVNNKFINIIYNFCNNIVKYKNETNKISLSEYYKIATIFINNPEKYEDLMSDYINRDVLKDIGIMMEKVILTDYDIINIKKYMQNIQKKMYSFFLNQKDIPLSYNLKHYYESACKFL